MLIHLKNQQLRPTLLLSILYLIVSKAMAVLVVFCVEVLSSQTRYVGLLSGPSSYLLPLFGLLTIFCTITSFCLLKIIHRHFFKKYPVTPLFTVTMALFGSVMVFVYLMMLMQS